MQKRNEQQIGEVIRQYLKITNLENVVFQQQIAAVWRETVGEAITRETESLSMQSGCLNIRLKSPSLKADIMMQRTVIQRALNQKLGSEIIKSIFVR